MADYTFRFAFFYLGNEKADVEWLTRWQAKHIFQLTPTPPGMEDTFPNIEKGNHISKEKRKEILKKNEAVGDEYLIRALEEKELRYLSFYLHAYEHRLNAKVYFFLLRNGMDTYDPVQFLDLKLHPYWKPRSKGTCSPFTIPAVLKSAYTNRKNGVCIYTCQNAKIPTVDPPTRRGKTVGILGVAFIEPREIHASPTAAAVHFTLRDRPFAL